MNYQQKDLVRIAKRENNTKRGYLVVDPLQGKHVPVEPSKALNLFKSLAEKLQGKYEGERLLLIGFAETATAIGAQAAITLGTKYIQTTREVIPDVSYLFFSEAHSHATEQKLVKDDIDRVINETDRIVFVEDEVTTGNTIMNIIRIIRREYQRKIKFAVVSLLNGMTEEYLKIYREEEIELHYLVKTDHSGYSAIAEKYHCDGLSIRAIQEDHTQEKLAVSIQDKIWNELPHIISIPGWMNARRFVDAKQYETACKKLAETVIAETSVKQGERVLVIGTEEFMYPALLTGQEIEKIGCDVRCHSTTRSPIAVSTEEEYPLHCRYELCSLYDPERKTFIYDLENYDRVIVMTDSALASLKGLETLIYALRMKNENISVIRWY
ncbi:phosphoribosyltransferase domain-containing protein [Roseburia sp.]|jgi:hypoxanthine-guanine phosphoribosyltransferase|uniref:phosphoribosyltransferase domain-containing protein n=1 Tax=Roseburia sp. TaxID=2049040 RepID=UPI003521BCDF